MATFVMTANQSSGHIADLRNQPISESVLNGLDLKNDAINLYCFVTMIIDVVWLLYMKIFCLKTYAMFPTLVTF